MKKNNRLLLIIFAVLCIGLILLIVIKKNENSKDSNVSTKSITLVNDSSVFFTIEGCVNRFINYVIKGDTNSLLLILNNEYQASNGINSSNILDLFKDVNGNNTSFQAKKMYYKSISNGYEFYLYGYLRDDILDSYSNKKDYYIMVITDKEQLYYNIKPLSSEQFGELV